MRPMPEYNPLLDRPREVWGWRRCLGAVLAFDTAVLGLAWIAVRWVTHGD